MHDEEHRGRDRQKDETLAAPQPPEANQEREWIDDPRRCHELGDPRDRRAEDVEDGERRDELARFHLRGPITITAREPSARTQAAVAAAPRGLLGLADDERLQRPDAVVP